MCYMGKNGWEQGEKEGKEPEEKTEDEGVERGMARHKAKPCHSEKKSPGKRLKSTFISFSTRY